MAFDHKQAQELRSKEQEAEAMDLCEWKDDMPVVPQDGFKGP